MPKRLSEVEFIALMAMMFATIAFSVDSMLPAMPEIAAELTPRAQLIITSFVLGLGTLVTGPLSDSFGRKRVLLAGSALYCIASVWAYFAQSLEAVLLARVVQGIGAAGPRVVALAMIRDLYEGRKMARLMSSVFLVFSIVPALAPAMGQVIIWGTGWRGIFMAFLVFATISSLWVGLRQPESLPVADRRPFRAAPLIAGVTEVLSHRIILLSIVGQSFCYAMLFTVLSSTQQVFDQTFGLRDTFPLWFAGVAVVSSSSSFVNAMLVERLGMRLLVKVTLAAQIVISLGAVLAWGVFDLPMSASFWVFFFWIISVFFQAGMTFGNLNTIAMEPLPHLAGMTASVVGALGTTAGVLMAAPIGLALDGTALPLATGVLACAIGGLAVMLVMGKSPPA